MRDGNSVADWLVMQARIELDLNRLKVAAYSGLGQS